MDPRNQRGPPVIKRLPTAHMNETSLGVQPRLPSTDNPAREHTYGAAQP